MTALLVRRGRDAHFGLRLGHLLLVRLLAARGFLVVLLSVVRVWLRVGFRGGRVRVEIEALGAWCGGIRVVFFLGGSAAAGLGGGVELLELEGVFVDLEVGVLEELVETVVFEDLLFVSWCCCCLFVCRLLVVGAGAFPLAGALQLLFEGGETLGEALVDLDFWALAGGADAGLALLVDLVFDHAGALALPLEGVGDEARLVVEALVDEVSVHVRSDETSALLVVAAEEVVEVEVCELGFGKELVVVVCDGFVGGGASDVGVGVVDEAVSELLYLGVEVGTPPGGGAECGDQEGVHLAAFVGSEDHAGVGDDTDVVEVYGGLDRGPGLAVGRIPDLDDTLAGGEDLGG